ncbi:F-box domain protein [Colletotrichum asianum]|uniref:F-box domain protein n=1 Tax=Colletotrichum asianum TaxID=702518 RepID=A0A8H3W348_9PEZI|nr:F-box domain protein [Colletotrichum asianum]
MPHSAAVIPAATTPLVVQDVETPQPGSHELLIKNELIALVPIDAKLAKLGVFPIPYPAILGTSYGGTVTAVGPNVTDFKVGDKVASAKTAGAEGNKFGAFQKQVIARDVTTSKLPASVDFSGPVGLIGNFSTVIGLFNEHLGLHKPDAHSKSPPNGKKILVYGGTSSFGSLSVQYLAQAGYDVVTTTSPRHKSLVAKLGAVKVIDHTQSSDAVIKALNAEGPYDYVVDSISLPDTIKITGGVLGAQGGGKIYALLPPFGPDDLPAGVTREFGSWSAPLGEEKNAGLLKWAFNTYFPQAIAENKLIPLPTQKIDGGLGALNEALDILNKGVSAKDEVSGIDAGDEAYRGLDPAYFDDCDISWVEEVRFLGFNPNAPSSTEKAFLTGRGRLEEGIIMAERGNDVNAPHSDIGFGEYRLYYDSTRLDAVFPLHSVCHSEIWRHLLLQHDIQDHNDMLYNVMFELSHGQSSLALELDYGIDMSPAFKLVPGEISVLMSPGSAYSEWRLMSLGNIDTSEYNHIWTQRQKTECDFLRNLPPEVLLEVASYLDTTSIFRAVEVSDRLLSIVTGNWTFWKGHLRAHMRWFNQAYEDAKEAELKGQKPDLMLWAYVLQPDKPDSALSLTMHNRKRIWSMCEEITRRYMAKWKREETEWYQNRTATSIINASHCDQLVSVQGNSVSKSKDLRTVPYIQSSDDFHRRRTIQAYFDINSGLVGLSYQPCDEPPRYFGRSGLEGLEETAFIASQTEPNRDAGIYKELVRLGDKASNLRKAVGQVNPGQGIVGFVLHTTCTEANAVSLKYTDFRHITLPNFFPICISAVTAIFDDGERLVLGSMGEAGVRRRVCHRALLLPDHADSEFVGILGQTIGETGQEEISRLGLLHALFESKQSLKSADVEAPNYNMLAKHLWAEASAVFQGRWIWECDDWLKLDMLEDRGINHDVIPKEAILWSKYAGDVSLTRLSAWLVDAGDIFPDPNDDRMHKGGESIYSLCGLRAEFQSESPKTIGMTDINGKSWPEEEIVHFDIDCGRKEEVVEVGAYVDLGHRDTLYVRTNHGREKQFTRNYDVRADGHCKVPIVPKGESILGVVMAFGLPSGWTRTPSCDGTEQTNRPIHELRASYASVTSLGVLSNTWSHSEQENSGKELEDESAVATLEGATAI